MITARRVGLDGIEDDFIDGGASKASHDNFPSTVSSDPPATESEHDDNDGDHSVHTLQGDIHSSSVHHANHVLKQSRASLEGPQEQEQMKRGFRTASRRRGMGKFAVMQ